MGIRRGIVSWWAGKKCLQVANSARNAVSVQKETLLELVRKASLTRFGKAHDFASIRTISDFQQRVPVRSYEQNQDFFEAIRRGESDICWPGKPKYLAKTSGTTAGAKYIPVTRDAIKNFVGGARDGLLHLINTTSAGNFVEGKMLFLSGSPKLETNEFGMQVGRLSGISHLIVPPYARKNRLPSFEINSIQEWETKLEKVLDEALNEDLRLISGIPPWVQMFFERLKERTGKMPLEAWPNLEVFAHGGVDFGPYEAIFEEYFGSDFHIWETYAASEGFVAYQNEPTDGMLLIPDQGIFFEFIPLETYGTPEQQRLTLDQVKLDQHYALILSTSAGLWAYDIGDLVRFVSLDPFRIKVSGRVKYFISAFGEHVIREEVNAAMIEACEAFDCQVNEFTVAPRISDKKGDSCHEWLVEFGRVPKDQTAFVNRLDESLRKQNPYYNDLRKGNILAKASLTLLPEDACRNYMKSIGKLGGQNKFPRLSNNRKIAEALYKYL